MTSSGPEPKILAVATASPKHRYSTEEIRPHLARWLSSRSPAAQAAMDKISRATQIDHRSCALPLAEIFEDRTFEERNDSYIECAVSLAGRALESALTMSAVRADEIDFIISTSCTGFMIPSLDAHLANEFGMKRHLQRLPVLQMGCAGGTAGLIYATDYLKAHPDHTVAVIACELPSLTLQLGDTSMANIVSTALFADGAACAILGSSDRLGPVVIDKQMTHIHDSAGVMGYRLTNGGLKIVLEKE